MGALLTGLVVFVLLPSTAHAAVPADALDDIPGWLQDALDGLVTALVKTLQHTARVGGVLLWGVLKVCGLEGLFGADFTTLFGSVVTEALNAILTGSFQAFIHGSLMVSLRSVVQLTPGPTQLSRPRASGL